MAQLTFFDELTNRTFVILDDFMGNVMFEDGSYAPARVVFPGIQKINHYAGYAVVNGRLVIANEANNHIAQFAGCFEEEITF